MSVRTCPICRGGATAPEYAPFCSKRCADIDLQRWFTGAYAVPVVEVEEDEAEPAAQAGRGGTDPL